MELTSRQAAERLGVCPSRIRQFVMEGRIKARLLTPRLMLIDEKELRKIKDLRFGPKPGKRGKRGKRKVNR